MELFGILCSLFICAVTAAAESSAPGVCGPFTIMGGDGLCRIDAGAIALASNEDGWPFTVRDGVLVSTTLTPTHAPTHTPTIFSCADLKPQKTRIGRRRRRIEICPDDRCTLQEVRKGRRSISVCAEITVSPTKAPTPWSCALVSPQLVRIGRQRSYRCPDERCSIAETRSGRRTFRTCVRITDSPTTTPKYNEYEVSEYDVSEYQVPEYEVPEYEVPSVPLYSDTEYEPPSNSWEPVLEYEKDGSMLPEKGECTQGCMFIKTRNGDSVKLDLKESDVSLGATRSFPPSHLWITSESNPGSIVFNLVEKGGDLGKAWIKLGMQQYSVVQNVRVFPKGSITTTDFVGGRWNIEYVRHAKTFTFYVDGANRTPKSQGST